MTARFNRIRKATDALCVGLITLCLFGCNAGIFAPQTAAIGGLQFDPIVQSNAQRAKKSAEFAQQQTCPEAAGYRNLSQFKADEAQAAADLSDELAQGIRDALEQRGQILGFVQPAQQRLAESRAELEAAYEQFSTVFARGEDARLRDLIPAMGNVQAAAREYGRDLVTVAEDFQAFNATNPGLLAPHLPNAEGAASDLRTKANDLLTEVLRVGNTEYTVPTDMSKRLRDFKVPSGLRRDKWDFSDEFESTYEAMLLVDLMGSTLVGKGQRDPAQLAWAQVEQTLEGAAESLLETMNTNTRTIRDLADQSQAMSAEATRLAWLAHEACGGELPPDFPDLDNPFDNRPTSIPDWSSTFWDISSP